MPLRTRTASSPFEFVANVDAVQTRQTHVKHHRIGAGLFDTANNFQTVPAFAHDLELPRLLQQRRQSFSHEGMVIGEEYTLLACHLG